MEPNNLLEWVVDTPFLVAFTAITLPALILSILGIVAVRILYPREDRIGSQVASVKINYMAEIYSLALGLFLISAYEDFQSMQSVIAAESSALRALHSVALELPSAGAENIPEQIRLYTKKIIEEEWPLLKFGGQSESVQRDLDHLFGMIATAGKSSDADRGVAIQAQQLAQQAMLQRAERISNGPGSPGLGKAFSHFLIVMTLIAIALPWFVYTLHLFVHILMGSSMVMAFMSVIMMSIKMLYPFGGELAIDPEPFAIALQAMLEQASINHSLLVSP